MEPKGKRTKQTNNNQWNNNQWNTNAMSKNCVSKNCVLQTTRHVVFSCSYFKLKTEFIKITHSISSKNTAKTQRSLSFFFFVLFQLPETSRIGQSQTFGSVNGSKSTRCTSRFKALGFESHRFTQKRAKTRGEYQFSLQTCSMGKKKNTAAHTHTHTTKKKLETKKMENKKMEATQKEEKEGQNKKQNKKQKKQKRKSSKRNWIQHHRVRPWSPTGLLTGPIEA